jgi:hypothetical protein
MFLAAARNGPQAFWAQVVCGFSDWNVLRVGVGHENLEPYLERRMGTMLRSDARTCQTAKPRASPFDRNGIQYLGGAAGGVYGSEPLA